MKNPNDDSAALRHKNERMAHWDRVAMQEPRDRDFGRYYHRRLERIYQSLIPPHQKILEIGCGTGELLASLRPSCGVGVDLSGEMVRIAAERHPELKFLQQDAHKISIEETFDYIILSDVLNDMWDVQAVLEQVKKLTDEGTLIIINAYSRFWEIPLRLARKFGLSRPTLTQNWLTVEDIHNLLLLADFELVRTWPEVLWPLPPAFWDAFCNRFLVRLPIFRWFALSNLFIARPAPVPKDRTQERVSVIVPARNEQGNITDIFERVPEMGGGTELILVEGGSSDNTYEAIRAAIERYPDRDAKVFQQTGVGKGDAVRLGFSEATGDILMILDADLTVPPEDLPRFFEALVSGKGDFINGVRLVYPMEDQAMRFANLLGNKFFSYLFSWLLGQPIRDTLCGTKVMRKGRYEKIAANRAYFGELDPFGDFDLILGAAKLNMKIVEVPVRYRERVYGATNISRWSHGWLLLKMAFVAMKRIKFL